MSAFLEVRDIRTYPIKIVPSSVSVSVVTPLKVPVEGKGSVRVFSKKPYAQTDVLQGSVPYGSKVYGDTFVSSLPVVPRGRGRAEALVTERVDELREKRWYGVADVFGPMKYRRVPDYTVRIYYGILNVLYEVPEGRRIEKVTGNPSWVYTDGRKVYAEFKVYPCGPFVITVYLDDGTVFNVRVVPQTHFRLA